MVSLVSSIICLASVASFASGFLSPFSGVVPGPGQLLFPSHVASLHLLHSLFFFLSGNRSYRVDVRVAFFLLLQASSWWLWRSVLLWIDRYCSLSSPSTCHVHTCFHFPLSTLRLVSPNRLGLPLFHPSCFLSVWRGDHPPAKDPVIEGDAHSLLE